MTANTMLSVVPDTSTATLPAKYTAVTKALAECVRVDECKDWADKSAALASYARQAKDDELLRMAKRIQARAMRRVGELLKEIAPAKNQHSGGDDACGDAPTSRSDAARQAGLSRDQKVTALRVASVPVDAFEAQVESTNPPTVTELADQGRVDRRLQRHPEGDVVGAKAGRRSYHLESCWRWNDAPPAMQALAKEIVAETKDTNLRIYSVVLLMDLLGVEDEIVDFIRARMNLPEPKILTDGQARAALDDLRRMLEGARREVRP